MASNGKSTSTPEGELNPQDTKFILECLKSLDSNRQVDIVKVGQALGYTNVVSVANRFRLLRKRHGFPNLECTNTSAKGEEKLSAASTKATGKKRAASSNAATKAVETHSESTEDEEPVPALLELPKRGYSKMMKAQRKGAKVSSKPIPATAPVTRNGAGAPKSKAKCPVKTGNSQDADQSQEDEGINSHLLHAVDHVVKEEEQADVKPQGTRRKA